MKNELMINENFVQNRIYETGGVQFMLDSDLADLYGVETKRINEAVRNNPEKFPSDFYFELVADEADRLRSKFSTFENSLKNRKYTPKVFTEQGVYMLATVLKSKTATQITLSIIRAFAQMRKLLADNGLLRMQIEELAKKQLNYEAKTDEKLELIFKAIGSGVKPKQGIFFDGQIYDAYTFVNDLIRSAKERVVLFDNYIDDTVLTIFSQNQNALIRIYTRNIDKKLQLDIEKYNAQYKPIILEKFELSHDRFLIIDDEIYHIGASLKDLGKKWFAFSKMANENLNILERV